MSKEKNPKGGQPLDGLHRIGWSQVLINESLQRGVTDVVQCNWGRGIGRRRIVRRHILQKKRVTRISTMGDKRQASLTCLSTVQARLVTESH